jgi:chemosensory pili system protein ChpA (sensor histidine kinase/response regulator)
MLDNAEIALAAVDAQPATPVAAALPAGKQATGTLVLDRAARVDSLVSQSVDPELTNVFLEEAREESDKISEALPAWDEDPTQEEALVTARRSFHTLKGSGRVVGATGFADFAWAIENLMNRLLDRTQSRSPAILDVLRDATAAVPQLIEQLASGKVPAADVAGIVTRAQLLAAGKSIDGKDPSATGLTTAITQLSRSLLMAAAEPEPSLADIYSRETATHINTVRGWLEKVAGQSGPHVLPEA